MKITPLTFACTCAREKNNNKRAAPGLTALGMMSFESVACNCTRWATISVKMPRGSASKDRTLDWESRTPISESKLYHFSGKRLHLFMLQSVHLLDRHNNTELFSPVLWELGNTWARFCCTFVQGFLLLQIYSQRLGQISCLSCFYGLGIALRTQNSSNCRGGRTWFHIKMSLSWLTKLISAGNKPHH